MLEHQLDPKTTLQFTRFVEFVTSATETEQPKKVYEKIVGTLYKVL